MRETLTAICPGWSSGTFVKDSRLKHWQVLAEGPRQRAYWDPRGSAIFIYIKAPAIFLPQVKVDRMQPRCYLNKLCNRISGRRHGMETARWGRGPGVLFLRGKQRITSHWPVSTGQ